MQNFCDDPSIIRSLIVVAEISQSNSSTNSSTTVRLTLSSATTTGLVSEWTGGEGCEILGRWILVTWRGVGRCLNSSLWLSLCWTLSRSRSSFRWSSSPSWTSLLDCWSESRGKSIDSRDVFSFGDSLLNFSGSSSEMRSSTSLKMVLLISSSVSSLSFSRRTEY